MVCKHIVESKHNLFTHSSGYLHVRTILLVPGRNTLMETTVIYGSQVACTYLIAHANNEFIIFTTEQPFGRPPYPESELVGVALLRSKGNTTKPY